jgi:LmbE family N-acetylglucosaminyl deacetylase
LMAVHAHPDDEATGTGGVLARYAAEGIQTVLVTCTDGRCGDGPGGVKPGDPAHHPNEVVALRRAELEASCAILSVSHLELLGYGDSGMMGWPANDAPGAFWTTPVDEAAAKLAKLIERYQPDVIVTYDENGFYGHPDHIQAHRVTMAAVAASGIPAKLYWTTAPRSMIAELAQIVRDLGGDWDDPDSAGDDAGPEIGLPDADISTWVDATAFGAQKFDALAAHGSQGDNMFFLQMGKDKFISLMGVETFLRVQDPTGTPLPEDDLFAGLR